MKFDLSIVLPCYNEDENIIQVYSEIAKSFKKKLSIEVLFINNGSTDFTENKIDFIINKNKLKNIKILKLNLKQNRGYGGAIIYGLKKATGKFICWTHADLQTPLKDCCELYYLCNKKNYFFAKGFRVNNRGFDGIITKLHEFCAKLILGYNLTEINAQPKMLPRKMLKHFKNPPLKWTSIDTYFYYIAVKKKMEIISMKVIFRSRIFGQSKWKNNYKVFFKHIFFNFIYLFRLRIEN